MKVSIVDAVAQIKRSVAEALSADSIEAACRTVQHSWRKRELDPPKTVWTFLTQVLHGNTACEHAVTLSSLSCSASAYCQARSRLPLGVWEQLLEDTTQMARSSLRAPLWHGHRTFWVDGSSTSMPDTPELQAYFGQPGGQQTGCGFPVAKLWGMFDARSGLLVKLLVSPLRTQLPGGSVPFGAACGGRGRRRSGFRLVRPLSPPFPAKTARFVSRSSAAVGQLSEGS